MEHEKLILSLQRRLTTLSLSHRLAMLCLLEQTLKEQHAVLAEAYRDRLRARRTKPGRQTEPESRAQVADARKGSEGLLRRLKIYHDLVRHAPAPF